MITGRAISPTTQLPQDVNIRETPNYPNGKIIGFMPGNSRFTGVVVTGSDTKQWIELESMNDQPKTGFIASWVVTIDSDQPVPPPTPTPVFPESFILTIPNGPSAEYVFVKVIE